MAENNNPKRPVRRVRKTQEQVVPNKKVKQGAKAGGKGLLIGMGLFVFFIILLIFGFFFYLTSNPNATKGIGISTSTIKSITSVFAGLVFGTLFVLFLILGLSYVYKLATQSANKTKNLIGTIVIFILGLLNLALGWVVYSRISKIKVEDFINSNDILIANINYLNKDGTDKIIPMYNNPFPLIGPIKVSFQFNSRLYRNIERPNLVRKVGPIQEKKFILECGNGQIIEYYPNNTLRFPQSKYCLYLRKTQNGRPYKAKLKLIYNTKTRKNLVYTFNDKDIFVDTNVLFKSKYTLNDAKNEIIVGERGDEVKLDITKIPEDLGLKTNELEIDFEGKGVFQKYEGLAKHIYHKDGAYNIIIRIPGEDQAPYYYFPIRVKPSTKPICTISVKENKGKYYFKINGEAADAPIKSYVYELRNITNGDRIKLGKGTTYKTSLKNGSDYQMTAIVVDTNKKKGKCVSEIINLSNKLNYKYDLFVNGKPLEDNEVKVSQLPFKYKLEIKNIKPENDNLEIGFDLDQDGEIDENGKEYEGKIMKNENKKIDVIVKDEFGNSSVKTINFVLDLKPLIGDLQTSITEGEAPLKVRFDASASEVIDTGDKIIYFNWDFDDGEKLEGTRQGIVEHTYKKPGKYFATVNIETKKGHKVTIKKQIDVWKPVNTSKILFPNNLGGSAGVGSPIKMILNTSGNVKDITWDFGDGKTYTCENRECLSISHSYEKKGRYKITAKVNYTDGSPTSTARASIYVTSNEY